MKMEISKILVGLLICAGLMACTQEKPESEKAVDGKASGTNELVIANTDANSLPSQEEDFSEETKAKLKKLREDAAILKAKAELDTAKRKATEAAAANYSGATGDIFESFLEERARARTLESSRNTEAEIHENSRSIKAPMTAETFESNLKTVEQFGFLNKYSNKEELMHQMRNIFNAALINGETSASPEKFEKIISDIESKLMLSGVKAQDARRVKEMLLDNVAP